MIEEKKYRIQDGENFFRKALLKAGKEDYAICLNGNNIDFPHGSFPSIVAFGAREILTASAGNSFTALKDFHLKYGWLFGYIGYDLKNELENLTSANQDKTQVPDLVFFSPLHIIFFERDGAKIISEDPDLIFQEIQDINLLEELLPTVVPLIRCNMNKNEYINKFNRIREYIYEGDVYELNLCMEFFSEGAEISPELTWLKLIELSPVPFSVYCKTLDKYLLSASPERFLKKSGKKLITQPIKGTIKRGLTINEDEELKKKLKTSEKEQAENMMITDLCRNDLARSSVPGTVKVEELFGIYSFKQVHQMISTIVSEMKPCLHWSEAVRNAFPMGSMTGAPKIRAMEIIEELEESRRGLFSGATGYITPDGDFDFNVVIRSIIYNKQEKYLSFHAGSAITWDSNAEDEYHECVLKTSAIKQVLGQHLPPDL